MFKRRFVSVMLVVGILVGLTIGVAVGYVMGARMERKITQCGMVAIEKGPFNSLNYVLNPRGWEAHHVSSGEMILLPMYKGLHSLLPVLLIFLTLLYIVCILALVYL